jgi:hypothetical protein
VSRRASCPSNKRIVYFTNDILGNTDAKGLHAPVIRGLMILQ